MVTPSVPGPVDPFREVQDGRPPAWESRHGADDGRPGPHDHADADGTRFPMNER